MAFVQEGIGALLAYLPPNTSVTTLKDFIEIIDPNLQVVQKNKSQILQKLDQQEENKRVDKKPAPVPTPQAVVEVEPIYIKPEPIKRVVPKKAQSMV